MTQIEIENIWNYYLSLENDFINTSQYIEPNGQENVYSFEFSKLLILSCIEAETILKIICKKISGTSYGDIGEYKNVILNNFPKIVNAEVYVSRWSKMIRPFEGWDTGKLEWWDTYGKIKHNREKYFKIATYKNAVYSLSALYLLILYLAKIFNIRVTDAKATYIISDYSFKYMACSPNKQLPDFDLTTSISTSGKIEGTVSVFHQNTEPQNSYEGDIWIKEK